VVNTRNKKLRKFARGWAALGVDPALWLFAQGNPPPHPDEDGEDPFWAEEAEELPRPEYELDDPLPAQNKTLRGLKNIAPALGVEIRAVTRWLERNPHLKRHLKVGNEYELQPLDSPWIHMQFLIDAHRGKKRAALARKKR
jgi:hypothetical protein